MVLNDHKEPFMDLHIAGKVALVTGESVHIGPIIATMLAAEGCQGEILAQRDVLFGAVAD